jgi:hypothetical protein
LSDLSDILKFNSSFRNAYEGDPDGHIVVLGQATSNSVGKFLKELFHNDHHMQDPPTVVIVQTNPPSKELLSILNNPVFEEYLHYLVGNIFQEETMKMVKIEIANGVYILNNQFNEDTRKDDTFALLASKAVREYSPKANIYPQLCNPEFLRHTWADWDHI